MSVTDGDLFPVDFWDPEPPKAAEYDCELATFDSRYDGKSTRVLLEVSRDQDHQDFREYELDSDAALILIRVFDHHGKLERTVLKIRSHIMREALRQCIKQYPGVDLYSDPIELVNTPRCLFFYFKELERYGRDRQDPTISHHMIFLLRYIAHRFQSANEAFPGLMKGTVKLPTSSTVDWQNLWLFFQPGTLVYRENLSGAPIISKVEKIIICECGKELCPRHVSWTIFILNIEFTGHLYEWTRTEVKIGRFDGRRRLDRLAIVPLDYLPSKDAILERALRRGKKYLDLSGIHHRFYDGVARLNMFSSQIVVRNTSQQHTHAETKTVRGRFIIDRKTYAEVSPKHTKRYDDDEEEEMNEYYSVGSCPPISTDDDGKQSLSDNEITTCVDQIAGFSLQFKSWCFLDVECIHEVEFNKNAFSRLLLPADTKAMMRALVDAHGQSKEDDFDDVIKGKGKGLVFLLHGVPGVGKTLTAESVAETLERPLYTITSGDLGIDAANVESKLSRVLRFAVRWKAIVLIDEADVFLAERQTDQLKRNALVSVFLRMLEYFEGVLILTTNRIEVIDAAFLSRVHHSAQYYDLSKHTRYEMWENFLQDVPANIRSSELDERALSKLASHQLNGRQIKNCMRTAVALANSNNKPLTLHDLDSTARATIDFSTGLRNDLVGSQRARRVAEDIEPDREESRGTKRRRVETGTED